MNQRAAHRPLRIFLSVIAAGWLLTAGCSSRNSTATTQPAGHPTPRIVSLVPAATDMLLAIGAGDQLVAVSNYDTSAAIALPRVGDYQTIDWEKISQLDAGVIITEFGPGRTPPGFTERCTAMNIRPLNLQLNRLTDIYTAIVQLGEAADEFDRAASAANKLSDQISAVTRGTVDKKPVLALIVTGEDVLDVAGTENYLNDLLIAAGGRNVVTEPGYAVLDREKLASLAPQAIIQLLPNADSRQLVSARQLWATLADVPAVRDHRVMILTDSYVELPGYEVGELAKKFAAALRTEPASTLPPSQGEGGGRVEPGREPHSPLNLSTDRRASSPATQSSGWTP